MEDASHENPIAVDVIARDISVALEADHQLPQRERGMMNAEFRKFGQPVETRKDRSGCISRRASVLVRQPRAQASQIGKGAAR
jgi:hypothetical protein